MVVALSLGCALAYGLSDFIGGLLARRVSAWTVAVAAQTMATLLTLGLALATGGDATGADFAWSALAGLGSGAGAGFLYRGLSAANMTVVAPVSALLAALLPVVVGVVTGDRPSTVTWAGVLFALPAIWLVSQVADDADPDRRRSHRGGLVDGVLAGLGFGVLFAALGQVPDEAGFGPLVLTQAMAVLATAGLAAVLRAPWVPRDRTALQASAVGVLGFAATAMFLLATQTGLLTVAAVLSSLYPATTVLLAAVVLGERIGRVQAVGLVLAGLAVVLVAAG
ncbi:MAG: DMT family transporter [Nocardioidaceae bacterium]|nr:DMT family transporter [Nocardioidaceae bacterium]